MGGDSLVRWAGDSSEQQAIRSDKIRQRAWCTDLIDDFPVFLSFGLTRWTGGGYLEWKATFK